MKGLDKRRQFAAIAGGISAVVAGSVAVMGRHGGEATINSRLLLIGVSVGITVGIAIVLLARERAS